MPPQVQSPIGGFNPDVRIKNNNTQIIIIKIAIIVYFLMVNIITDFPS